MNPGERRFARYLDAHGYGWQFEPDYQREFALDARPPTTPDFLVEHSGVRVICEVRQFETTRIRERLARSGGYAALSPQQVYGALRWAMVEKAEQLRPFAELDVALAIVLTNPLGADVMLDEHHVTAAMFGNPGVSMRIDTTTGGGASARRPARRSPSSRPSRPRRPRCPT